MHTKNYLIQIIQLIIKIITKSYIKYSKIQIKNETNSIFMII